ncbi:RimK family alpha-L-glutamate ligase [Streptomyces inhibens]|uniref:RimK family alpha-L-glutamate ligase n=1 Tax=Streptomyces inhibens TaxID=2293571 RepID=UPI003796E48B
MTADLVTMFWIRSERESKSPNPFDAEINSRYDAAARAAGVLLSRISVDDVVVGTTEVGASVRVRGELVAADTAFFHTKLVTWPVDRFDYWRHLTTYAALSAAGFYTTFPVGYSLINNEKLITALRPFGSVVPRLPTVRLSTRGYGPDHLDWCTAAMRASDIAFPVVVKPSSWGGGNSVFVASNAGELDTVLTWAAAAELTVVVQPWLGRDVVDYRVFYVDGEPYRVLTRKPRGDALAGNVGQGGVAGWTAMPDALVAPARAVARDIELPYLCIDFLCADGQWWFSEIEIDGGTTQGDHHMTEVRFGSYRSRFDTFVGDLRSGGVG